MKMTTAQVREAYFALAAIINTQRPMPQVAKYRIARMYAALEKEGALAEQQRLLIVTELGLPVPDAETGEPTNQIQVPPDKMPEYTRRWEEIAAVECEISVQGISIAMLGEGGIEAAEFMALGELITD